MHKMMFKLLLAAMLVLNLACNPGGEGAGDFGYSNSNRNNMNSFQGGPQYQSNNAQPNFSQQPIGGPAANHAGPGYTNNIGDFTTIGGDTSPDPDREFSYEFTYAGRGCSHHGASGGPANTESNGVLTVDNRSHSYNLTRIRAVSGGQQENIDKAIRDGVGIDVNEHVHVGDVYNEYKERAYDSMVYIKKIVNHRAKINNQPIEYTFSNYIPTNIRFGYKCSEMPNGVSYPTQITQVNTNTTKPATMTVTTEMQGEGKCIVKTHFDIPSDTGTNGGKIYEKLPLSRYVWYHYDESNPNYIKRIDSESLRAGTRDNKVYRVEMSLKLCKFKPDNGDVQMFDCNFSQVGCSI